MEVDGFNLVSCLSSKMLIGKRKIETNAASVMSLVGYDKERTTNQQVSHKGI